MNYSHLPHIDMNEYYQFITFRTADSTDSFLLSLAAQGKPNREKQMVIDEYLDASQKGAYLYGDVLRFLFDFIRSKDGVLCELVCFAVMPNHVHLLIKPLQKLAVVMQRLKGASAKGINDLMGRRGSFWEKDYYDKAIRDEHHFRVVYQYIKNNPLKLNVNSTPKGQPSHISRNSGGAAQGECCLPQRERPGVLAVQTVSNQGSGSEASASPDILTMGTAKTVCSNDLRFYGIYDV